MATSPTLPITLTAIPFRAAVAFVGVGLLGFFTILLIGALVNLPDSWPGVLYCAYGLFASACALRYAYAPKRLLLLFIAPAVLAMAITSFGTVS